MVESSFSDFCRVGPVATVIKGSTPIRRRVRFNLPTTVAFCDSAPACRDEENATIVLFFPAGQSPT